MKTTIPSATAGNQAQGGFLDVTYLEVLADSQGPQVQARGQGLVSTWIFNCVHFIPGEKPNQHVFEV